MGWKVVKTTVPMSPRGRRGFTLFELLVVLILLGAAAAVVVPSFTGGFGGIQLETAARDLVTHMRQARGAAVTRQRVQRVFLLVPEDPKEPFAYVLTDDFEQPLKQYFLPQGISYLEARSEPLGFSFYPNGRSSGGRVGLRNEAGRRLFIEVSPITGFGHVQRGSDES